MDPSTTHAGRRFALRALTVGGAAVAVMVAAALPAAAADSTAATQTATDTAAVSTAVATTAASTTDASTADSTATTATTDTATATAAAATATDTATTAVADSSATDTATTAVADSAATPAAPVIHASAKGSPGTGTSTSASHSNGTSTANSHGANAGGSSADAPGKDKGNGTGNPHNGDHNPPGNNGTVKIHDVAGDTQPYDVPHLSCFGYVDFFGFDAEQTVTVSFTGQAPTGKGIVLPFTWTGMISTDQAGGAGNDFDYELPFTADQLGVTSLGEPAAQGYHVKMLVETGEPGGKKYKVFWIQPCGEETGGGGGGGHHHHGHHGGGGGGGHHHHGGGGETSGGSSTPPTVQAVHEHRSTPKAASSPQVLAARDTKVQALPFTGVANLGAEILAALTALTGGAAMSYAGRRRRPAKHRAG